MSINMSATQIIIHKIDPAGVIFKHLCMSIEDGDDCFPQIKYSEWIDGKIQEQRKDTEKSSRLVVKIISGNELDKFNLDVSAKEVDDADRYINNTSSNFYDPKKPFNEHFYQFSDHNDKYGTEGQPEEFQSIMKYGEQLFVEGNYSQKDNYLSPLEHSLEKVKENNARIMENIHMLNRTLNYTKKKEILDIVCPKSMRSYPCNTCGKCFVYETGLRRHYSMRHVMAEIQPRWQVVWTCIQCFQVWPHQDQALKHASKCCNSNNLDCVREIKTSSLLQCEFCEKVYTSIPRLLRHSKLHTTTNNYECNACGMTFSSYKTAEQHWVQCPWLTMYYSFSLPKLLLCNACDRKFRNYEQLYNHRYKVGHFLTKTHCSEGTLQSMGVLVYQCEMCGQWFPSITPLKDHKNEFHLRHDTGVQFGVEKTYNETQNYYAPGEKEYYVNKSEEVKHGEQ